MNRIVRLLIISDFFILTGFGLVDPILAVFVSEQIEGGSLFTAGLATGLFLVTKSLIQIPFSRHVDNHNNMKDLRWLFLGSVLMAAAPLLYLIAEHIVVIFIAQLLLGTGMGIATPVWLGIWSTHLDEGRMSYEWSLYSTLIGLGTAAAAAIGGGIAEAFGFDITFIFVFCLTIVGSGVLIVLARHMRKSSNGDSALLYKKSSRHKKE